MTWWRYGTTPLIGRWFTQEDDTNGAPATVILSNGYWRRKFGADVNVAGRTLNVDGTPRQVIGVMPKEFRFLNVEHELILPQRFDRAPLKLAPFSYSALARLKPNVSIADANADVARLVPIFLKSWPENGPGFVKMLENARFTPNVRPLKHDVVGNVGDVLWVLMGTIGIVLVIACADVANLVLVRVEGRQQELAVRTALGAGWRRIARALLLENVTLALMGGALGLLFAFGVLRLLVALRAVDPGFARPDTIQLARVAIPGGNGDPDKTTATLALIRGRFAAMPGVSAVAFAGASPMDEGGGNDMLMAEDRTYKADQLPPIRHFEFVSPGFFSAIGTPLLAGRDITWAEVQAHRPVVVVSENLAREMWGEPAAALGKRVREHPRRRDICSSARSHRHRDADE